jgi:hypothetical protein
MVELNKKVSYNHPSPLPYNLQDILMFHLCHPVKAPSNLGTHVSHSHKVPMLGKVNEDLATLAEVEHKNILQVVWQRRYS